MRKIIKVSIDDTNLNTSFRKEKAQRAADALYKIVNHPKFEHEFLRMKPEWTMGETSHLKQLNNKQLFEFFCKGKEEWNEDVDNEIDLIVDDYYRGWSRVVGYMNPGRPTVYVNTKFFDSMELKNVVSNFLHEYMHTLGARHSGPNLRKSIPYFMNHLVTTLWDQIINDQDAPSGYWSCRRTWYTLWLRKKCRWNAV